MTDPKPPIIPRTILCATDLSSRCDRALDRAVLTARYWHARLVLLTVVEPAEVAAVRQRYLAVPSWRKPPSLHQVVERRLRLEATRTDLDISVRVGEGPVADTILRVADEEKAELIVTGVARDETLGRMVLGTTVDALVRRSPSPVLIVRNRARMLYHRVALASELSPASRHALETVARLFPGSDLSLIHALEAPYSRVVDLTTAQLEQRELALQESRAFVQSSQLSAEARKGVRIVLEYGSPSPLVNDYVQEHDIDLIVIHSSGRSKLVDVLIGSSGREIMKDANTDVLVVRAPES